MAQALGSPADPGAILAQIPPGELFDYAKNTTEELSFPTLTPAFWPLAYLAVTLASAIIVLTVSAFAIRVKRGRLHWVVQDGNLTRLNYIPVIALLSTIDAGVLICFTFIFRRDIRTKHWSGSTGRLWFTCHLPLVISWGFLMVHVMSSAPPIRRLLSTWSRWKAMAFLNGIQFALAAGLVGAIFVPAIKLGNTFMRSQELYEEAIQIIAQAKARQNPLQLVGLQIVLQEMEPYVQDVLNAIRLGGIIFCANGLACLSLGIFPAYALSVAIRRKIVRYENNSSTTNYSSSQQEVPTIHIPLNNPDTPMSETPETRRHSFRYPVNKDAPFSNVVDLKTTLLPARFQEIVDQRELAAQDKAVRLRAVLKQEQLQLLSYALLIFSFSGMTVFMAVNGETHLSTAGQLTINFQYSAWAYILSAIPVAILFFKSSLSHLHDKAPRMSSGKNQAVSQSASAGIVLTQVLSIAEDVNTSPYDEEEKKLRF